MKPTKNFEEAFKELPKKVIDYNSIFPPKLIGATITDLQYGPDHDGDPCLYYIVLDNGIKIGIAILDEKCNVDELDHQKLLPNDKFIRFQFHDWPEEE